MGVAGILKIFARFACNLSILPPPFVKILATPLVSPTPSAGQPKQRGEGVAIVPSGAALEAWKARGKGMDCLKLENSIGIFSHRQAKLKQIACDILLRSNVWCQQAKNEFFDDLQQILDKIPSREQYVILGDFNVRVGSRESEDDQWGRVHGPHGLRTLNEEAGRAIPLPSYK